MNTHSSLIWSFCCCYISCSSLWHLCSLKACLCSAVLAACLALSLCLHLLNLSSLCLAVSDSQWALSHSHILWSWCFLWFIISSLTLFISVCVPLIAMCNQLHVTDRKVSVHSSYTWCHKRTQNLNGLSIVFVHSRDTCRHTKHIYKLLLSMQGLFRLSPLKMPIRG